MMGCTASSTADDIRSARVFDVANIDDSGRERSSGKLEVTSTDLVLYYPSGPGTTDAVLRWPFQALRRYGFNDHLFSFESGRRCPSGHGIYAFRCSRAEHLFRRLQEAIARAGEERSRSLAGEERRSRSLAAEERSRSLAAESRSLAAEIRRTEDQTRNSGNAVQTAQPTNSHLNRINSPLNSIDEAANFSESWRRYVNNHETTSDPRQGQEVNATTPQPQSPTTPSSSCLLLLHLHRPPSPPPSTVVQYAQLELPMELVDYDEEAEVFQSPEAGSGHFRPPNYVNLPSEAVTTPAPPPTQGPGGGIGDDVPLSSTVLTYAQLDLDPTSAAGGGDGGRCEHPSSSRDRPEMYSHIDFRRTIALMSSTRTTSEADDEGGFRKTRHNSSVEIITGRN